VTARFWFAGSFGMFVCVSGCGKFFGPLIVLLQVVNYRVRIRVC